jgi:hypothetical protein
MLPDRGFALFCLKGRSGAIGTGSNWRRFFRISFTVVSGSHVISAIARFVRSVYCGEVAQQFQVYLLQGLPEYLPFYLLSYPFFTK